MILDDTCILSRDRCTVCFDQDLAKINQDRACVVHPFMGSETCALLCVYDGHGERGDMVR